MKRLLPYIFIVLVMIGFLSPVLPAHAQQPTPQPVIGTCDDGSAEGFQTSEKDCTDQFGPGKWHPPEPTEENKNPLSNAIGCDSIVSASAEACLTKVLYYLFFSLPSGILVVTAKLFDVTLALTLSTFLLENNYLSEAWRVVRDFSNIFFILVLLYVAFELILGIGHGAQKMIIKVIIVGLLINFSMLATKVVIDTSNVLALIFYNKIVVITENGDITVPPNPTINEDVVGVPQKNFSTAIAASFDPTQFIDFEKFNETKTGGWMGTILTAFVPGGIVTGPVIERVFLSSSGLPTSMAILLIFISCVMFLAAAYAFFIAAVAFMGRLIEFWILIIFSPFAFMSTTLPKLESMEYIGWHDWSKRLFSVAFMAPIFMFFMLIISKLIQIDPFGNITNSQNVLSEGGIKSFGGLIITTILPAIINIGLLLKATEYAKKGGGQFGEMLIKGGTALAGVAGGLALGAATGGTSLAATTIVGGLGSKIAKSEFVRTNGALGRGVGSIGRWAGNSSFDFRNTRAGKQLASATGINVDAGKYIGMGPKESYEARKKAKVEKRLKRAQQLEVGGGEHVMHALHKTEEDLQKLLTQNAKELETIDKLIEKKRQEAADAERDLKAGSITQAQLAAKTAELKDAKSRKSAWAEGRNFTDASGATHNYATTARTATGDTIDDLEKRKKTFTQDIKNTNRQRMEEYAGAITSHWWSNSADKEAAHKLRMEYKLEGSGSGH